jgi:hypothetical protein
MVSPAALDAASEFIKDFGIGFCVGLREAIEIARRQVSSRTMRGKAWAFTPALIIRDFGAGDFENKQRSAVLRPCCVDSAGLNGKG